MDPPSRAGRAQEFEALISERLKVELQAVQDERDRFNESLRQYTPMHADVYTFSQEFLHPALIDLLKTCAAPRHPATLPSPLTPAPGLCISNGVHRAHACGQNVCTDFLNACIPIIRISCKLTCFLIIFY